MAARAGSSGFSSTLPLSGPIFNKDVALGAFVLPNAVIPDNTPLTAFSVPGKHDVA
jgi:hypothetical protein